FSRDWSSDVCSSDLHEHGDRHRDRPERHRGQRRGHVARRGPRGPRPRRGAGAPHHLHLRDVPTWGGAVTSTRTRRAAMTVALAAVLTAGAGTAHADPSYDEAIQLSWDGRTYTSVTAESFLGTPVSVPGDSASRTLLVRNDGPTAGTLRASIVNVELADPDRSEEHTSELQSRENLVCRLLLEKKKKPNITET